MEPAEIPLRVISFKNLNLEISKGRGLLVKIYKLYYAGLAFTMKMSSGDKIKCGIGIRNKRISVLK
jgi:hypothetical protein